MTVPDELMLKKLNDEIEILKKQLDQSRSDFLNIVGKSRDGILVFDNQGVIVYVNPAALQLFGKNLGYLLGENIGIFIDSQTTTEITLAHKDRGPIVAEVTIADTTWNNEPAKLASLHDVTAYKAMEKWLKYRSHFDYLTGLPNRIQFMEEIKKFIGRAARYQKKMALLYMDVDGFKKINDTYGHDAGDLLLIQVAEKIKSSVRINDLCARLGGDEFAILVDLIEKPTDAEKVAHNLISKFSEPIMLDTHSLQVSCSIGIAIYPQDTKDSDDLIKKADQAMYKAKKSGGVKAFQAKFE